MEYQSVTQKVLFDNAVLTTMMSRRKYDIYLKTATVQEKATWIFQNKVHCENKMQCHYGTQYAKDPPSDNTIRCWSKLFQEAGSVLHRKGVRRLGTSLENVDQIQEAFYQ